MPNPTTSIGSSTSSSYVSSASSSISSTAARRANSTAPTNSTNTTSTRIADRKASQIDLIATSKMPDDKKAELLKQEFALLNKIISQF